ncbi:MAG: choice-of-anchor B family protein [Vicingaceae bacterium]|nr:choice-of-anchor B family protein [Vicingaceae bacterium]
MIKRTLTALLIVSQAYLGFSQSSKNINLLSNLTYPSSRGDANDIWGIKVGNNEYALVGLQTGVSIVDVTNPTNPVEVFYASGAVSTWRDLKTWNNHVYITNETSGGLMIIDLNALPGTLTAANVTNYTGSTYPFQSAHNLYIDENGVCYVFGANNGVGGAIMLDLSVNPKAPIELGRYNSFYLHDGVVRGDTLWGAAVNNGFFIVVDISNKTAPVNMASQTTSSSFTHNIWFSDDGQTVFTTDEVGNAFIDAYDVSNLTNITFLDKIQSSPGQNVIPHNAHFMNDYVITSYYRDGVVIHDVSDPSNMIEVGHYDTSPAFSGDGFNGAWGTYPWLPSGNLLVSDIENGLFVLGPTYVRAAYLEGNVTNSVTSATLDNVLVEIVTTNITTTSNLIGNYKTGTADAGTYDVIYSKFGFFPDTLFNVTLTAGITTIRNVALQPMANFTLQGQVLENWTNNPIANAQVKIENSQFSTTVTTDVNGNFAVSNFIATTYDVSIAHWGHENICLSNQMLNSTGNPYTYTLNIGYYDDFDFDLGWTATTQNNPTSGFWERDAPVGTFLSGIPSNPGNDISTDCGNQAYVTGNGGGGAGSDDIDGGTVILTSPIFDLSSQIDPYVHFSRWFFNAGGSGNPDDSLVVILSNGTSLARVDFADANSPNPHAWVNKSVQVSNFLTPTSTMQLIVKATDEGQGHIAEAGFDGFFVIDSATVSVAENILKDNVNIYPNPFNDVLNITFSNSDFTIIKAEIYDITGKLKQTQTVLNQNKLQIKTNYSAGIYFIRIYGDGVLLKTEKVIRF